MSHGRRLKARESALEESATGNQHEEDENQPKEAAAAARPRNKSPASSLRTTIKSGKSVQGAATKGSRTTKASGKDRHSKVNTARGPRDRRVRLSVSTAIQFYDIQDRLGFDQPSKAIEWLLRKAKPAIDELHQQQEQQQQRGEAPEASEGAEGLKDDESLQATASEYQKDESQGQEPPNPGVWKLHEAAEFSSRFGSRTGTAGRVSPESRAKATRDRGVREKDKSSGSKSTTSTTSSNTASREPVFQQQGFGQGSSFFENLYTGPAGMRSSFTQLLQAPISAAILQQGSPHNLLQNPQFLQGLYSSQQQQHYGQQQQQQHHGSSSSLQHEQHQVQTYALQQQQQAQQEHHGLFRSFSASSIVAPQVPNLLSRTSSGVLFPHHSQMNVAAASERSLVMSQRHAERNLLPFNTSDSRAAAEPPHHHQHHHFQQLLSLEATAPNPLFATGGEAHHQEQQLQEEHQHFHHQHHHRQARHYQQQDFFVPRPVASDQGAAGATALYRRIPARIQGIDDIDVQVHHQEEQQQHQRQHGSS